MSGLKVDCNSLNVYCWLEELTTVIVQYSGSVDVN